MRAVRSSSTRGSTTYSSSLAPPATADSATRSQWLTRDAAARLAIRNHLPLAECAHFGQHKTAKALYDVVVARYSSPATAALGRLLLPYLFPEVSAFATIEDLVTYLRTSDARYRAALPADFLDRNPPPMYITLYFIVTRLPDSLRAVRDHFLALDPTNLTVDLLKQHLLVVETSVVAIGAARGTPRTPFFQGCSPSPLAPSYASTSASGKRRSSNCKGGRRVEVAAGVVVGAAVEVVEVVAAVGVVARVGALVPAMVAAVGVAVVAAVGVVLVRVELFRGEVLAVASGSSNCWMHVILSACHPNVLPSARAIHACIQQRRSKTPSPQQLREWFAQREASRGSVSCPYVIRTGDRACRTCGKPHTLHRCSSRLDDAWRAEFGDEAEHPRWAELLSESTLPGTAPAEALHTFTLDSGASCCFFRDSTTLTPLSAPVPVRLVDPSGGPVLARSSTVLPCPTVPSGSLSSLHLPSFSTNLVSTAALQDAMVTTTTPGAIEPPQVAASAHVSASGPVAPPCSFRLLTHQTLLWHHRLGHPSLPRLRGMHSRLLVSGLPRSLPPLPPSTAPPCLPCVEGRQRAAPHSSFPPTTAALQTLHMDVWCPAHVSGQSHERYFLLVVDDYTRYTTDLPFLRLNSDRGGEFSSDLLHEFCRGEGILLSFMLPTSPQQNGIAERRIGLVMEVACTSMIHADAPHFLWPFAVRYAAHQLKLWPRVSLLETLPTLPWKWKDVTFDESVPFYPLFPYRSAPLPPPPLFLAPGPPLVDLLPTQGPAPSGVSRVDPLPGAVPVEVAVDLCTARGLASSGATSGGVEPAGAEPGGAESEGAGSGGAEPGGAEPEGAESGGSEPRGTASFGGSAGASPRLSPRPEPPSPHQLREWFARRTRLRSGAAGAGDSATGGTGGTGAGGAGATSLGDAGVPAGAGGLGGAGAAATGTGGAGAGGTRASGPGGRGAARAGGAAGVGAGGTGAGAAGGTGAAGPGGARTGGTRAAEAGGAAGVGGGGTGTGAAGGPGGTGAGSGDTGRPRPGLSERRELASRLASPIRAVRTGSRVPRQRPPPVPSTHPMALRPSSVPQRVPLPSPPASSLADGSDPESDLVRAASPTVPRLLANVVTDPSFESVAASALVAELVDFAVTCRLDYAASLVAESECDCPPSVRGECALGTDILEDRQEDFECFAAAVPHLVSMLIAPVGDPDALDIPTPRSYTEAITSPYSSQCQAAMDAEMASWKSTGTYVDAVPPPRANIVDGMWIFRVKRPPGSPPAFKARYPPAASLRSPPSAWEWHKTLRTTLAAPGFAPSTADPSLFRLGHPSLPRLCGMHSRLFVSSIPSSLPPLPPSTALPCLPCVKGRQRATPHSSSFPLTSAPLQTLHMDV
ncbi:unnamed protein product [Closterium sp. NIES-53]